MPKRWKTIQAVVTIPILCVAVLTNWPTLADSLQRKGSPRVDGVTLIDVKDGKLHYRTAGGDQSVALVEVAWISIDSVPEFAAGLSKMKAGQLRAAQRSFENVWSGTRVNWVKHYAGFFLMQVYDQRTEPVDAAAIFVKLAAEGADLAFLSQAPTASLAKADANQKKRIGDQVMAVVKQTRGKRRELLRAYHQLVLGKEAVLPEVEEPADAKKPKANPLIATSKILMPKGVWDTLDRKREPKGKWDAIKMLAKGDAQGTLKALEPWLKRPGDLPEKLFIQGLAQIMLADQSGDTDQYRDAGLTFMRIVIHFDRAGQAHPLVAPAKLEVAYIHRQIGRTDIYKKLVEQVLVTLDDDEAYPYYRKRYDQVLGEAVPNDDDQP